jgi:hypothetical protein
MTSDDLERASTAERLSSLRAFHDQNASYSAMQSGAYQEPTCGHEKPNEWLGEVLGPILGMFVTREDMFKLGCRLDLPDLVAEAMETSLCWIGPYAEPADEVLCDLEPLLRRPNEPLLASITT